MGGWWRVRWGGRGTAHSPRTALGRSCRFVLSVAPPARTPPARSHAALLHDADGHRTHGSTRRKSAPVGGGIGGGVGRGRPSALRPVRERGAPPTERTDRRPCDIPTGLEPGCWPCTRGGEAERRRSGVRRQRRPRRRRETQAGYKVSSYSSTDAVQATATQMIDLIYL